MLRNTSTAKRPQTKPVKQINLVSPVQSELSNGIPFYSIGGCSEDVSRIDIVFRAGVWNQPQLLVAFFTNQMLREGTIGLSSIETAERLDYYGSWLQLSNDYHQSYVTLYSLNKYLPQTLEILEQMIKYPTFPEEEFQTILNARKQQYIVDSQKVNVLASRCFQKAVYGEKYPYGKVSTLADYDILKVESLKDFYGKFYHFHNCSIILSGNVTDKTRQCVGQYFGKEEWGSVQPYTNPIFEKEPAIQKHYFIPKENAVQSAVVIGSPLVSYSHPEYHALQVLNTVLGGYFGSRLMSNIREKKGYTYGISSHISAFLNGGHFAIMSQTGNEFTQLLIKEVYHEIEKLCQKPVSQHELKTVQNYMLGDAIRNVDGVFAQSELFISLLSKGLTQEFYKEKIETIKNITPEILQQLAQRFFVKENFYEVICGAE